MAVVVSPEDTETFISFAEAENLTATAIAAVTDDGMLKMEWNGKEIVSLKRDFLHTNGAAKNNPVHCFINGQLKNEKTEFNNATFLKMLSSKEVASQKGMIEHFDSTVYGNTCLMPFGGKYQDVISQN